MLFPKQDQLHLAAQGNVQLSFEYFQRRFHNHSGSLFHYLTAITVYIFSPNIYNQNFPFSAFDCCLKKVCFIMMLPIIFTLINKTFYINVVLCRRAKDMTKKKKQQNRKYKWRRNKKKKEKSYKFHFASSTVVL